MKNIITSYELVSTSPFGDHTSSSFEFPNIDALPTDVHKHDYAVLHLTYDAGPYFNMPPLRLHIRKRKIEYEGVNNIPKIFDRMSIDLELITNQNVNGIERAIKSMNMQAYRMRFFKRAKADNAVSAYERNITTNTKYSFYRSLGDQALPICHEVVDEAQKFMQEQLGRKDKFVKLNDAGINEALRGIYGVHLKKLEVAAA